MKTMTQRQDDPHAERTSALAADLRALIGKLKRRLREQAASKDLTPSQVSVILRLEQEGAATVSALARAEGVRPQSMGTTVAALAAAGLVRGEPDPNDGRRIILSLTDACRQWITDDRAARQDWLCRALQAKLSPQEQEALAASVDLLKRLADD
jgi:DNA-binding MarR family transcriptional regulator